MKLLSIIVVLTSCVVLSYARSAFPDLTDDNFQNEALAAHNLYRAKHKDTPPLVIDPTIVAYSKKRCNTVSTYEQLNEGHAGNQGSGYGENLYWSASSVSTVDSATPAIKSWYDEISKYSYSSPGFSSATGHFTQVVWKGTTSVGCARCGGKGSQWYETYVTCNYKPPGNYLGQFDSNVLPLCGASCPQTNTTPTPPTGTTPAHTTTNATDDKALIESARKSTTYTVESANVPKDSDAEDIANIAFDNVDNHDTLYAIEEGIRKDLDAKYGGKWLVIVTGSASNYFANSDLKFKYALEFYTGGLRFFIYQVAE